MPSEVFTLGTEVDVFRFNVEPGYREEVLRVAAKVVPQTAIDLYIQHFDTVLVNGKHDPVDEETRDAVKLVIRTISPSTIIR